VPDKTTTSTTIGFRLRAPHLKPYLGLLLVLVIAGGLYLPMVFEWFQTDDFLFLNAFRHSNSAGYVKDAFDIRHAPPLPELRFYRPLHSSTFLALYHVLGLHAAGYHLWSLAIHLLNVCLIWLITGRLTKRPLVANLAAALFALHPAYTPAVAWISNNNALMATAAGLTSLWFFLKSEESGRHRYWYWASVGSYCASLLFHPEAGTVIVALTAYRLLFDMKDWREALSWRRWLDLVPFLLAAAGYLAIHGWMVSQDFLPQAQNFQISDHMIRVYLAYLALCVYPISLAQFALTSRGPDAAAAAMVAVLGLLLYLGLARGRRPATFAVIWLLAALVPLSTVAIPVGGDVFGRKLYVAGPALALTLALLLAPAVEALGRSAGKAGQAALVAVCVGVLSLAGWRVVLYQNQVAVSARQSHSLIVELRHTYPEIQPGTRLFLVDAPPLTFPFIPIYPQAMIGLYYDDVDVIPTHEQDLPPLQHGDLVFRYGQDNTASPP
jgi:hypothetical protein